MEIRKLEDRPRRLQVFNCLPDREYGNICARHRRNLGKARWKAYGSDDNCLLSPCQVEGQHG